MLMAVCPFVRNTRRKNETPPIRKEEKLEEMREKLLLAFPKELF